MIASLADAGLLFALAIPIVMQYRVLPVTGTPYWLFGVLFFLLGVNAFISFDPGVLGIWKRHVGTIKTFLLVSVLTIVVGAVTVTAMVDRARVAPVWGVHDIILQEEAAMRYLKQGKNPYLETYFGTPMESFRYAELGNERAVNPGLYHFVMPPWYLIFPFVFYYTVRPVAGFFDARMASLFTMALLLFAVWHFMKDKAVARIAVILTAISPAVINYFIEGRSDVFALSWFMVSLLLLSGRRYIWSGVFFAFAVLSKQTIWFAVPFAGIYLWQQTEKNRSGFWHMTIAAAVTATVLTLPFFIWNPSAFMDSVIFYLNGTSAHSYPVSGYGLGMVLYDAGIIRDIHAYYPFILWQAVIGLPLFVLLVLWMRKHSDMSHMLMAYAVFLTAFWYMSRYFNNSHLGYLSMLYVIALLKRADERGV